MYILISEKTPDANLRQFITGQMEKDMATITVNGSFTHDESAGLQTSTTTDTGNDVEIGSLPLEFSDVLGDLSGAIGAAVSESLISVDGSGLSNLTFVNPEGIDSGLQTVDGDTLYLFQDSTNSNIIYGQDGDGNIAFALYLDAAEDNTSAEIWSVQFEALYHPDSADPDDSIDLSDKLSIVVSEEVSFSFVDAPAGQNLFMAFGTTGSAVVVTGLDPANESEPGVKVSNGDTVNSSEASKYSDATLGSNNQSIGLDEGLVFTYVTGMDSYYLVPDLSGPDAKKEENILFEDTLDTTGASVVIAQIVGDTTTSVTVSAWYTEPETGDLYVDGFSDDTQVPVSGISIDETANGGGEVDPVITDNGDGTFTITNLEAGDLLNVTTDSDHNRLKIEHGGTGGNFDLGDLSLSSTDSEQVQVGHTIVFDDDGLSQSGAADPGAVHEDALSNGVPDTLDDTTTTTIDLSQITFTGTDGVDRFEWNVYVAPPTLTSLEEPVEYTITGSILTATAGTRTIFTAELDSTDETITVTLLDQVDHPEGSGDDSTVTIDLSDGISAIDGDGDSISLSPGSTTFTIENDVPVAGDAPDGSVGNSAGATTTESHTTDWNVAADEEGHYTIQSAPGTWSYVDANNNGTIEDHEQHSITGTYDGIGYELSVDSAGYTFTLLDELEGTSRELGEVQIKAGGPDSPFIEVAATNTDGTTTGEYFQISSVEGDPVNESNRHVGVSNGNVDLGETLEFQLLSDRGDLTTNDDTDEVLVDMTSISISSKSPKTAEYGFNLYNDGVLVYSGTDTADRKDDLDLASPDGDLFDTVEVWITADSEAKAQKLNLDGIIITTPPDPLDFDFEMSIVDEDGDQSTSDSFTVTVDPDTMIA